MLRCPTDEGEPVGQRIEVSNETSIPSGNMTDRTDGEDRKIDDSYDKSVAAAHA